MTPIQQGIFWAVVFLAVAVIFYLLRGILAPFLAGVALAYMLSPLADKMEGWKCPRSLAAIILTILAFSAFVGIFLLIVPPLLSQGAALAEAAPLWAETLQKQLNIILTEAGFPDPQTDLSAMAGAALSAEDAVAHLLAILWGGGSFIMKILSFLILTPITTLYLLRDWNALIERLRQLLPRGAAPFIQGALAETDSAISAFLRGQISVCLILASFYAIGFTAMGLEFGLVIGIFSGLISFIPYAGAALGSLLAVSMALMQFSPEYSWALVALAICLVGQAMESYALTPWLVGGSVGLHPLWILLALAAFGTVWGFTGMLIAIPVAAAIGIAARRAVLFYKRSDFYLQAGR